MAELQIILTEDGSKTLFNPQFQEIYHSRRGAYQESLHVFVEAGLGYAQGQAKAKLRILEVGFGTGLNALLTWQAAQNQFIHYTALEAYPVPVSIWQNLDYATLCEGSEEEAEEIFLRIHEAAFGQATPINEHFVLDKVQQKLEHFMPNETYDLIYYDAFAPQAQPEMWELPIFEKLHEYLLPKGILVTYCAKGSVKRHLRAAGFEVESLPGPIGKREMIRAHAL